MRTLRTLLLLLPGMLLVACAPISPVPTSTSSPSYPPSNGPYGTQRPSTGGDDGGAETSTSGDQIKPTRDREVPGNDAVNALLKQAWSYQNDGKYDAAIAVAERAQRLNATNPEVYLVLGSAHFAQYQVSLAEQLVRKGIAFSAAGSTVQRRLKSLLAEITAVR